LRILLPMVIVLFSSFVLQGGPPQAPANPGTACGERSKGLPDFYYEAVLAQVGPPDWRKSLVRIVVGRETKLALWTDGETFKLWTDTVDIPQKNIGKFLLDLDRSCRLPADPAIAAGLVKIRWESRDLSAAQFDQIHRHFTVALSGYATAIQDRYGMMMETKLSVLHLDSEGYSVQYDNSYQHVELEVWNLNDDRANSMIDWVHHLAKLGAESFHRPIWTHEPESQP
jgi:hypothetical protein